MYFRDRKLHIGPAVRRHVGAWQLSTAVGGQTVATLQGAFGIAGIAGQPGQIVTLAPTYGGSGDYHTLLGATQPSLIAASPNNGIPQSAASFLLFNGSAMQHAASLLASGGQTAQSNSAGAGNITNASNAAPMAYRALSAVSSPSGSAMQIRVAPNSHWRPLREM